MPGSARTAPSPAGRSASPVLENRWVENRPGRQGLPFLDLRELWAFRDVGVALAQRDVKLRYRQTVFGVGWAVLQPLLAMAVFALLLGRVDGLHSGDVPYVAFVIAGLAVWFPLSTGLGAASESLAAAPELVTRVYFPRLYAPLGAILAAVLDLAVALVLAQVVALIAGVPLQATVLLLPVCAVGLVLVALAAGLWLSALNVLYRDVRHAVPFLLQLGFFASPVVYASSVVEGAWQWVFALNPLVGLVDTVRWAMLGTPGPGAELLVSVAATLVMFIGGMAFFRRTERQFADRI